MKIEKIEVFPLTLRRTERFTIATGSSAIAENMLVRIQGDDYVGWGNACPSSVTNEDISSVLAALELFSRKLAGMDATKITKIERRMDELLPGNPSAKAAIDIALYDLFAKSLEEPLYKILGAQREKMMTDISIGIEDLETTVLRAKRWRKRGFKALKIKVGLDLGSDIERLKAVRGAVGKETILRVDGNQGYNIEEAVRLVKEIEPLGIEFLEQPLKFNDLAGMKKLTKESTIPIMADESLKTKEDAMKLVKEEASRLFNIKLMKCGGILRALAINSLAEAANIRVMIGCMGESLVSISAGLHFALSHKNVDYADLDSHFTLKRDVARGISFEEGYLYPSKKPGLGIDVDYPELASFELL